MRKAFTFVELLIVVFVLAILISVLLPLLTRARSAAVEKKLNRDQTAWGYGSQMAQMNMRELAPAAAQTPGAPGAPPARPQARVKTFEADIVLTPRLSVGTAEPESIYEARFSARIAAVSSDTEGDHEILLPLPPEIISLSDLSVKLDGQPSELVALRGNKLVWRGPVGKDPTPLEVTYTAFGRGLYALEVPPGGILDVFKISLTANDSDVRMLSLSLQPTRTSRAAGTTQYTWDYKRLMFGQPIQLDVLGIAPIDRLGDLSLLGPISVVLFGTVLGLVAGAFHLHRFDRWMLLLILGTFTGSYPLMYFAQEFVSLQTAILVSAGAALLIIAARSATIMGFRLAMVGVVLPGAAIMAITLLAAIRPDYRNLLLTVEAIAFFVMAMILLPLATRPDATPAAA